MQKDFFGRFFSSFTSGTTTTTATTTTDTTTTTTSMGININNIMTGTNINTNTNANITTRNSISGGERNEMINNDNNNNNNNISQTQNKKIQELNQLMDPSNLTRKQKICIIQMITCIVANHIHRFQYAIQEDIPASKYYPTAIPSPIHNDNNDNNNNNNSDGNDNDNDNDNDNNNNNKFNIKNEENIMNYNPTDISSSLLKPSLDATPTVGSMLIRKKSIFPITSSSATTRTTSTASLSSSSSSSSSLSSSPSLSSSTSTSSLSSSLRNKKKTFQIKMHYPIKKKGHNCDKETCMDYIWAEEFLIKFFKYLNIENESRNYLDGLLWYLSHGHYIDPTPFMDTLEWKGSLQWIRVPLLLLGFSISVYGYYHSRIRGLVKYLMDYIGMEWNCEFITYEYTYSVLLTDILTSVENTNHSQNLEKTSSYFNNNSSVVNWAKWGKIAGVGLFGGSIIALSGGLAAPAIASGVGAIGLTATGTFLLSTAGTTTLTLLFGVTGASYTGYKMKKVLGDIKEFELVPIIAHSINNIETQSQSKTRYRGLSVVITIPGWMVEPSTDDEIDILSNDNNRTSNEEQLNEYWQDILGNIMKVMWRSDCYCLLWESKTLFALGNGIEGFAKQKAITGTLWTSGSVGLGYTALGTLVSALSWPATLLAAADIIDNPWAMASAKAKQAGKALAESIMNGDHGRRPITLIGWSLGGRVIFYCLLELVRCLLQCNNNLQEEESSKGSTILNNEHNNNNNNTAKKSMNDYLNLSNFPLVNVLGLGATSNKTITENNITTTSTSNSTSTNATTISNETESLYEQKSEQEKEKEKEKESEQKKEAEPEKTSEQQKKRNHTIDMICGMIENVILIGAPCTADEKKWKWIRSHIVCDRIINCYSQRDWVLKFVYRTNDMTHKVCGLEPITDVMGIENIDLSAIISGHGQYFEKTKDILKYLMSQGLRL